jgi:hypothetical protein
MSSIIDTPAVKTAPEFGKKPRVYSVWSTGDNTVMVQIEDIDLARAFAKVKGVHRAGYSVGGGFLHLYSLNRL